MGRLPVCAHACTSAPAGEAASLCLKENATHLVRVHIYGGRQALDPQLSIVHKLDDLVSIREHVHICNEAQKPCGITAQAQKKDTEAANNFM
eukprot:1159306-Pelagomonas_calceolata.AAC.3